MMKSHLLTFAVGVFLGAAAVMIVVNSGNRGRGEGPAAKAADRRPLTTPGDSRAERPASPGSTSSVRMESKSERVVAAGEKKRSVVRGADKADIAKIRRQMLEAEKERSAKRVNAKLASLVARLGLDAAQEEQVRALLERQEESTGRLSHLIKLAIDGAGGEAGNLSAVAVGHGATGELDFDAELRDLLDADQLVAYEGFRDEQRANEVEIRANQELTRMQRMLDLTWWQKDRAFEVLARLAEEDLAAAGDEPGKPRFNHARYREQQQRRQDAMAEILSPEQLELYAAGGGPAPVMFESFSNGSASIRVEATMPEAIVVEEGPGAVEE